MITIKIQNLKCHGCANTITKGLQTIEGVTEVKIEVNQSKVSFNSLNDMVTESVKLKLLKMGYPEVDTDNSTIHKAKSYISCAIGRIND
jgi:copper chaperone